MMQTCSAIAGLALNDELDAKLLVETGAVEVSLFGLTNLAEPGAFPLQS